MEQAVEQHEHEHEQEHEQEHEHEHEEQEVESSPKVIRVLHVQMTGAQTQETLSQVATMFQEALDSGKSGVVVTDGSVMTSIEYTHPGESDIDGVVVRPAMTPVEACAIAYQAQSHANSDEKPVHWNDLDLEVRQAHLNTGLTILNLGAGADPDAGPVFVATLLALAPYLVAPSNETKVEVWTGETNLHSESAWLKVPFSVLREQMIFRMPERYPDQYFVSHVPARVQYSGTTAQYVIDSSEAVVSGSKQIDDQDITKGFTLAWKVKEQEPVSAVSPETEAQIQAAVDAGNIDFSQADETILTDAQDPSVVTDVEYTSITNEAAEDALHMAPAAEVKEHQ